MRIKNKNNPPNIIKIPAAHKNTGIVLKDNTFYPIFLFNDSTLTVS